MMSSRFPGSAATRREDDLPSRRLCTTKQRRHCLRCRHGTEALSLHAAPILVPAQEFPEATQPPVNRHLSVAEIFDERPPEKKRAITECLVTVKAQVFENQRECGESGAQSVRGEIE